MKQKHEFKSIVAETLLIPLYMRAKESRRVNPILDDKAFWMTRQRNGWQTAWNTIIPNSMGQS